MATIIAKTVPDHFPVCVGRHECQSCVCLGKLKKSGRETENILCFVDNSVIDSYVDALLYTYEITILRDCMRGVSPTSVWYILIDNFFPITNITIWIAVTLKFCINVRLL